jgi:hypothetical protein
MSLNLVSPGVKVREVDLTVGRIDAVNDQVGAIAGPFVKGPVGTPVLIETEQDLVNTFGKPSGNDGQYEYWMAASSYLSYGGTLRVVRSDSADLINAHSYVSAPQALKITTQEDYTNSHQSDTGWTWAARESGSWANGTKVCVIDNLADQRVSIGTFGIQVGYAITIGFTTSYPNNDGTVGTFTGYLKGIVSNVNVGNVDVKIVSRTDTSTGLSTEVTYSRSAIDKFPNASIANPLYVQVFNNVGTATSLEKSRLTGVVSIGVGQTNLSYGFGNASQEVLAVVDDLNVGDLVQSLNGTYKARVVSIGTTIILSSAAPVSFASTTFVVTYAKNVVDQTTDKGEGLYSTTLSSTDWYDQQTLGLENSTIYWKSIASKPGTSQYASERNSKNDEVHIVVVDDSGSVTGISGNILEKFIGLSKAVDARISPSENVYYKNYVSNNSQYIFAGEVDTLKSVKFTTLDGYTLSSGAALTWGQETSGITFGCVGTKSYTLTEGFDYSSSTGGFELPLSDIISSYEVFKNPAEYNINFILQGPSGGDTIFESQAKANALIAIAEERKDCIACISPHRAGVVNVPNTDTQTDNIIDFYDGVSSSSYAVFDSGYKYMFDRFNNAFRYVPLNGDTAGLMARTSINNYPWFSPAGSSRGVINNAVKLAFNPSQSQRDLLYPKRINPVVFSPGAGIILFGDKTALSYSSAFDRINVRRLFLTLEATIERAARAQLFEFNDTITRTNFVNIVEPYLRDVKAKRGITDFLVICDESNNTADVIDANQFKADIFIKPARSINFIGLTFVANRTGVSFEEVVGTV